MYETGVIISGTLVIAHGGGFEVHGQCHHYQKGVSSELYTSCTCTHLHVTGL